MSLKTQVVSRWPAGAGNEGLRDKMHGPADPRPTVESERVRDRCYSASTGSKQRELLRVLCASKVPTRRTLRVSVTSAFSLFSATENTEKKSFVAVQGPAN